MNTSTGCTDESTVLVSTDDNIPVAIRLAQGLLTCETTGIMLDGSMSSSNSGNLEFQWFDSSGADLGANVSIQVQSPGIYSLIVTDPENCCSHESEDIEPPVCPARKDTLLSPFSSSSRHWPFWFPCGSSSRMHLLLTSSSSWHCSC